MTQRNKNLSGEGIIINDLTSGFFDFEKRRGYLKTLVRGRESGVSGMNNGNSPLAFNMS